MSTQHFSERLATLERDIKQAITQAARQQPENAFDGLPEHLPHDVNREPLLVLPNGHGLNVPGRTHAPLSLINATIAIDEEGHHYDLWTIPVQELAELADRITPLKPIEHLYLPDEDTSSSTQGTVSSMD